MLSSWRKGRRPLRHHDPDPGRRAGGSGDPGDHDEQRTVADPGARHHLLGGDFLDTLRFGVKALRL